ncbi:MAG: hypothetical protein IH908_11785 [Proteobacteria bacterium]|nr:hypothetical protein [Pseudomonadota bacterium]
MSWEEEIRELRERERLAFEMGGPEKVARQHEFNKRFANGSSRSVTQARSMKSAPWLELLPMMTKAL